MKANLKTLFLLALAVCNGESLNAALAPNENDLSQHRRIDLAALLRSIGLDSETVLATSVAHTDDDANGWRNGLYCIDGKIRSGSLGITAGSKSQTGAPPFAIKVSSGIEKLQGLIVEVCAGGQCKVAPAAQLGINQYSLQWEGVELNLVHYGELCSANDIKVKGDASKLNSCSLFSPSWALKSLLTSQDEGISGFPQDILLVQTTNFLITYDIEQKQVISAHDLSKSEITQALGTLKGATFYSGGDLIMTFEGGILRFSYGEDIVMVVNRSGEVYVKKTGIGVPVMEGFVSVADDRPGTSTSNNQSQSNLLLAVSPKVLISEKGLVRYDLTHRGFSQSDYHPSADSWLQAVISTKEGQLASILVKNQKGEVGLVKVIEDTQQNLQIAAQSSSQSSLSTIAKDLWLSGENVLSRRSDGWSSLDGKEMILAGRGLSELMIGGTGSILVKRKRSSIELPLTQICEWTRHRRMVAGSGYHEDGVITAPCNASVEFNLANTRGTESVVIRDGSKTLDLYIFFPNMSKKLVP